MNLSTRRRVFSPSKMLMLWKTGLRMDRNGARGGSNEHSWRTSPLAPPHSSASAPLPCCVALLGIQVPGRRNFTALLLSFGRNRVVWLTAPKLHVIKASGAFQILLIVLFGFCFCPKEDERWCWIDKNKQTNTGLAKTTVYFVDESSCVMCGMGQNKI